MSGNKSSHSGLTRRSFLKTTAAVAGATALAGGASLTALGDEAQSTQPKGEQEFCCGCGWTCYYCQYKITTRDGYVVKCEPFEDRFEKPGDEIGNRPCLRGRSQFQRIYSDKRVKYPMKRVGERGEGKFERISWDQAIKEISEKIASDRDQYGPQSLCWYHGSGGVFLANGTNGLMARLMNELEVVDMEYCTDMACFEGMGLVYYGAAGYFFPCNEASDNRNAKIIVNWGGNLTDAYMQEYRYLAEAKEKGAVMVTIDPNYTGAVAKSDKWIRLNPGTDGALALGIINYLFQNEMYAKDFCLQHTVAPVLINPETKGYLRMSDLGVEPVEGPVNQLTGQPTIIDPPAVWDEAVGKPVAMEEAEQPAISGTHSVEGMECRTAFDIFAESIEKYTLEEVEKITGVPAEDVIYLAELYATGEVLAFQSYSVQAYVNGTHSTMAIGTLTGITGSLGKSGAGWGAHNAPFTGGNYASMMPTGKMKSSIPIVAFPGIMETGTYLGAPCTPKNVWISHGNPLMELPDGNQLRSDVWDKFEMIVCSEINFSETANYADYVLPVTHYYEAEDVQCNSYVHYNVRLMEKAVDAPYECKPDGEIACLVGQALGLQTMELTAEDYINEYLASPTCQAANISLETLREKKTIRYMPGDPFSAPVMRFTDYKFSTPSGRIEFYFDNPTPRMNWGQEFDPDKERMPYYYPAVEAGDEELAKKYPFVLMSQRQKGRWHGNGFANPWILELEPEPTVLLNPKDAEPRGIKNGDYVEAFNDRGTAVAKAIVSEGVAPGIAKYKKGFHNFEMKAGSWADLETLQVDTLGVNCSFMDNRADIRLWEGVE